MYYEGPKAVDMLENNNLSLWGHFKCCMSEKYCFLEGRACRREYWGYLLYYILLKCLLNILIFILAVIATMANPESTTEAMEYSGYLTSMFDIALLMPTISVSVRRLHDVNLSGWFVLIPFFVFVIGFIKGTPEINRYGYPPYETDTNKSVI